MFKFFAMVGFITAVIFAVLYLRERHNRKKLYQNLDEMLDTATEGNFSESHFDESRLSKIESEFANYLESSEASAKAAPGERDRIKALIADISHQTKTPIANMLLYSELLEESDLTEDQREDTEAIHSEAQKLKFLIEALVKLSRLENGIIQLHADTGDVIPVIREVVSSLQMKADAKGLTIECPDGALMAVFDPKWTEEALFNIADNAVKYTEKGTVRISCVSYEMFVRIDIADTGIGIPEEDQTKIFSRFYRARTSADQEGVGLGLYLAREIISQEGGYIRVSSVPGKGSCFSVFLPAGQK